MMKNKTTTTTTSSDPQLRSVLVNLKAQAASLQTSIAELEKRLGLTSRRVPSSTQTDLAAQPEPPPPEPLTLRDQIRLALMHESLTPEQLSKTVASSLESVKSELKELRAARPEPLVFNVGMGDSPVYTWRIGDKTDTPTLRRVMERLLWERPMTTRQLADATGARMSRVEGVIVALRRDPVVNIQDFGVGHAGLWLITDPSVKGPNAAPLAKRKRPKDLRPRER